MTTEALLLLHAAATVGMTGVIWFVQVVHYPLFLRISAVDFVAYAHAHVRRTTWVVAPLMLTEVGAALWLMSAVSGDRAIWNLVGIVLLFVIWLSTAVLQVPCHRRLERGFEPAVARRLVRTNWIRTIAWTARAVVAMSMLTV